MVGVVIIGGGHGLRIEMHHSKEPNKSKLLLYSHYFHLNILFKQLYTSCKMKRFSYKGGCGVRGRTCIEVFERRAGLGYR